jgi:uncharacterized oxidoreductase
MPTFPAESLEALTRDIFVAAGANADEAKTVATVLLRANLSGHDSHGVLRVPQYCAYVREGYIVPGAALHRIRETPTTCIYDANWGFGQVSAMTALEESFPRAREMGLVAFGIRRCNHIGRLGHYGEVAAEDGFVALLTVNNAGAGGAVAPFGGRQGRLGTNPMCVAVPSEGEPVLIDMTSSVVAEGKIRIRRNRGERLPEGWIFDAAGNPSTDPNDFYGPPRGAILPFGGPVAHKGFALGMMVDLLSGALAGAGTTGERSGHVGNGVFCLLADVEAFRPLDEFRACVADMGRRVKDCPPADGFDEVLLPGEPEARARRARYATGVFIEDATWAQIVAEAERYGCRVPNV